jgi:hypothetical protein
MAAAPPRSGRPDPAERRRRRTRTLALVVAIALVATLAVPFAALAAPRADAGGPVAAAPGSASTPDAVAEVLGGAPAHEVWLWTTTFLRGGPAGLGEPLEPAEQWVAAADGGTRTAWRDPSVDRIVLAASDDDTELAAALGSLTAADRLVTDEGDWLVVAPDGTVRALLPDRSDDAAAEPVALADFQLERSARWQATLAEARDDEALGGGVGGPVVAPEAGGGLRAAVPWAVGAALLLTGTALAVRARRERDRGTASARA